MRDYGKWFLGLILAGIILIVVGLMLARAHPRATDAHERLPQPSGVLKKAPMEQPVPLGQK